MVVVGHAPPKDLAHLVNRFLVIRSAETAVNNLLPTSGVTLVFRVHGSLFDAAAPGAPLPGAMVTGGRDFPRSVVYGAGTLAYVVELVPGAASYLLSGDLEGLWGTTVAAETVADLPDLGGALADANETGALEVLARVLRQRLRDHRPHRLIEDARALVAQGVPRLSVGRLVDQLGTNKDSLEKRFRREWGATPKVVLRIERLRGLISTLDQPPGAEATWAQRAHRGGYADQSHLNREFRALVGRAPQAFLQGRRW